MGKLIAPIVFIAVVYFVFIHDDGAVLTQLVEWAAPKVTEYILEGMEQR